MEELLEKIPSDPNGLFQYVIDAAWKKTDQKVREKAKEMNQKKNPDLVTLISKMNH